MAKYVIKRLLLMLFTFAVIVTICFVLIRMLPQEMPQDKDLQKQILARWDALGYNEPLIVQFWIYIRNIFTNFDFGTSWYVDKMADVTDVIITRLPPTILVNLYSLLFSIPIGIALGIYAAIKKNKWQDHTVSVMIMLFVSIPSYVYAFIVQYLFYYEWKFVSTPGILSLQDAGGSWFSPAMFKSMIPAIIALSFGEIAGLARFTRAELTESLTSEYMLLARTKGLSRAQATTRHALKNAMVPILPMIISSFIGIIGGSMIIEKIFGIPGVGQLYLQSITLLDYDLFMCDTIIYTFIGLLAGIVVDISYGFIDPRIRMGER